MISAATIAAVSTVAAPVLALVAVRSGWTAARGAPTTGAQDAHRKTVIHRAARERRALLDMPATGGEQ